MEDDLAIEYAHQLTTPVSKLFDELLESIFLISVPSWSSTTYYPGPTDQRARAISQVCSRWRQLSLAIPSLWKSIEHHTQEWTEELLRRSAHAPFIEIKTRGSMYFDSIIHTPGILPRIRFFDGNLTEEGWAQLSNGAQQPGAQLEHLSLYGLVCIRANFTFHGHAPPLRYMRMVTTRSMNLASPFFCNLRDVEIRLQVISLSYLASIAANMSLLERLCILDQLAIENEHLPHQIRIHFPRLQKFSFLDQNFLRYVDVPPECVLRTSCNWPERLDSIANIFRRLIYDHTQRGNPWLCFKVSNDRFVIHNGKEFQWNDDNCDALGIDTLPESSNSGWCRIFQQHLIPYLTNILPTINMLGFEFTAKGESGAIGPFLSHFTAVQSVWFGYSNVDLVFPCLKQLYDDGSGPRMLLPSLKTLYIPQNDYLWERCAPEVKSYLAWRIEQGAPIESIGALYDLDHSSTTQHVWSGFGSEIEDAYGLRVKSSS